MLDIPLHYSSITLIPLIHVCQLDGDEGPPFFSLVVVLKGMHDESVAEINMFTGGYREKYVCMHAVQGRTCSEMVDNLVAGRHLSGSTMDL